MTLSVATRRFGSMVSSILPFTTLSYDEAFRDRWGPGNLPSVTASSAMALPAAYACTVVISEDIAKVPLQMFERDGAARKFASNHPLYDLLHDQPNPRHTALQWREWMTAVAVNRGRAVSEIVAGDRGFVDQLVPLSPERVQVEEVLVGKRIHRRVRYDDPHRGPRVLVEGEFFLLEGRFGMGVVEFARRSFGTMLSRQQAAAEHSSRGFRSPGFFTHPKRLEGPARDRIRKALDKYMGGEENAGRPMLLEEGMDWKTIALSMEDAQFVESLQHDVGDVCRWYRVPQHKIQELLRATNNNIEQQSIDYVTDSLLAWAVRWEQAIRRDLILAPARFFAKHNLEGLLRGDTKTRYEAYAIAVQIGWMTRAEVRDKEDMDPRDGLDEPLQMLNMGNVPGTSVALDTGGVRVATFRPDVIPEPSSPAVVSYLRTLVRDGASRVARAESNELSKLADKGGDWEKGVRSFYGKHSEFVARVLRVPDQAAEEYCLERQTRFATEGPDLLANDRDYLDAVESLTSLALRQSALLQTPDMEALAA